MMMDNFASCWQAAHAETLPLAFEALRTSQMKAVQQVGWPTRRMERWKYADLRELQALTFQPAVVTQVAEIAASVAAYRAMLSGDVCVLVLVNGTIDVALSDALPAGLQLETLWQAGAHQTPINANDYPIAALNQSLMQHGAYLRVQGDIAPVLHIISVAQGAAASVVNTTLMLAVEENARVSVVEHAVLLSPKQWVNQLVTLSLASHASVLWVKHQASAVEAAVFSHYQVEQAEASEFQCVNVSDDLKTSRDEVIVNLNGPHARCKTAGVYYLKQNKQWVDNHIEILHRAAHTSSDMLYKGILDQASRAVFNGRLWIGPETPHIAATQGNHHLLLSNAAEAYSKPELEIYSDEVKCQHGATTGELDQDAMFYLRARGLSVGEAKQILMRSFVDEVIAGIKHPAIKTQIEQRMAAQWM